MNDPLMFGYCYTQLTDVFQEQNGVYRLDRTSKLDVSRIRAAQLRSAATEAATEAATGVATEVAAGGGHLGSAWLARQT
ncbi:hypothetical protein, partial [Nonomuraea sp. NPDC001699]